MRSHQFLQAGALVALPAFRDPQSPAGDRHRQSVDPQLQQPEGLTRGEGEGMGCHVARVEAAIHRERVQELFAGEFWAFCVCGDVSPACDRFEDAARWRCDTRERNTQQAVNQAALAARLAVAQFSRVTD